MNPRLLKQRLEQVHRDFVRTHEVHADAIAPALGYQNPLDRELAAFVCAVLAYGKVAHIQKSIRRILQPMGPNPRNFLLNLSAPEVRKLTAGWSHRFNTARDMETLLRLLQWIYRDFGSLEPFALEGNTEFLNNNKTEETSAFSILQGLIEKIDRESADRGVKLPVSPSSFWYFLPRPSAGSACKRLNLFLRWMIGRSEMDLSLWNRFSTRHLVIPLDTHIHRQARLLKLTSRSAADWKTALEVTDALRKLDPDDPTRFDFALCHLGMKKQYGRKGLMA